MRYPSPIEIQIMLTYLFNKVTDGEINAQDFMTFMAWLSDKPGHITTQTEVGEKLGLSIKAVNKHFTKLQKAEVLQKTWTKGKPVKVNGHTVPQFKLHSKFEVYVMNRAKELKINAVLKKKGIDPTSLLKRTWYLPTGELLNRKMNEGEVESFPYTEYWDHLYD